MWESKDNFQITSLNKHDYKAFFDGNDVLETHAQQSLWVTILPKKQKMPSNALAVKVAERCTG